MGYNHLLLAACNPKVLLQFMVFSEGDIKLYTYKLRPPYEVPFLWSYIGRSHIHLVCGADSVKSTYDKIHIGGVEGTILRMQT